MNIAHTLKKMAKVNPHKRAVVVNSGRDKKNRPSYSHLTFRQLDEYSDDLAFGLKEMGIIKGHKTLVFIPPCLEFSIVTFALFKAGAIPIFIDPGMGRKNLFRAIREVGPKILISIPKVHFLRRFFPRTFKSIKYFLTTSKHNGIGTTSIDDLIERGRKSKFRKTHPHCLVECDPLDMAAILFTSGGTGSPKGVVYTQKIFNAQVKVLKEMFQLGEHDIDCPGFPLFSLFTLAMGMTSCLPDFNPSRPAKADPKKLVELIINQGVTFAAGSPAIWENVADYCFSKNIKLPSVKYLAMFGAPVSTELHRKFKDVLINGTTYTPYGATEALPISNISGARILEETAASTLEGKGTCVGLPAPGSQVKIIKSVDGPIISWSQVVELAPNQIGEIVVLGDVVTQEYYKREKDTAKSKIKMGDQVWHRMGDMGHIDEKGRLWFCGRVAHKVQTDVVDHSTLYSIQCEAIFNQHPMVKRSALVGVGERGHEVPVIIIEKDKLGARKGNTQNLKRERFKKELIKMAQKYHHTQPIKQVLFHPKFPVDVRHNIKIDRIKLREWAQQFVENK